MEFASKSAQMISSWRVNLLVNNQVDYLVYAYSARLRNEKVISLGQQPGHLTCPISLEREIAHWKTWKRGICLHLFYCCFLTV